MVISEKGCGKPSTLSCKDGGYKQCGVTHSNGFLFTIENSVILKGATNQQTGYWINLCIECEINGSTTVQFPE